jgi:UDP-N-acetylglucosamine:LPS N-acetylglucosamine transferase
MPIFSNQSKTYKFVLRHFSFLQNGIVWIFNFALPAKLFRFIYRKCAKSHINDFLIDHPADIYISTYYADTEVFRLIKEIDPAKKTVIVVVDIVFSLRLWFSSKLDLIIIPTSEVKNNGRKFFKNFEKKVEMFGLPVAQNLFQDINIDELKKELGLSREKMILIAGGGEGMNQVPGILKQVDINNKNISICVICGKDKKQKLLLEKLVYKNEVKILGWVDNFTQYLYASDIVITKAGPATIWESITTAKKIIIYGYIGGVENGDVNFALENGMAVYEKNPLKISKLIPSMLSMPKPHVKKKFQENWAKEIINKIMCL